MRLIRILLLLLDVMIRHRLTDYMRITYVGLDCLGVKRIGNLLVSVIVSSSWEWIPVSEVKLPGYGCSHQSLPLILGYYSS